jgi:4a-hydroxytetrahydrobiopterin dehydratase
MVLSEEDIQERLAELKDWTLKDEKIVKILQFPSFMEAIDFVNKIAKIAEIHNHHPIININWKTVRISLKSFDVNSITERDFSLASAIEEQIKKDY